MMGETWDSLTGLGACRSFHGASRLDQQDNQPLVFTRSIPYDEKPTGFVGPDRQLLVGPHADGQRVRGEIKADWASRPYVLANYAFIRIINEIDLCARPEAAASRDREGLLVGFLLHPTKEARKEGLFPCGTRL